MQNTSSGWLAVVRTTNCTFSVCPPQRGLGMAPYWSKTKAANLLLTWQCYIGLRVALDGNEPSALWLLLVFILLRKSKYHSPFFLFSLVV